MSEGLNRVYLAGNLAADPAYRMTQNGGGVLSFRVACGERYKKQDGSWADRVEFVSCVLFGKRAEALSRLLAKGSALVVEGSLRTSSYDKDGQKHWKTEVVASNIILTGGKPSGPRATPAAQDDDRPYDDTDAF